VATSLAELDRVDRLILRRLQEDARRSFKEIAQEVKVSEATIFVRVRKLIENGVIKGFRAVVNPELVGKKTTAIVLLKAEPRSYGRALEELLKIDSIEEIYDVTGAYYSVLKIRTNSIKELADIIDNMGKIEGIVGTETAVVLRTVKEDSTIKVW